MAEHKGLQAGWRGCTVRRAQRDPIVFRWHQNADTEAEFLDCILATLLEKLPGAGRAAAGWQSPARLSDLSCGVVGTLGTRC